MTKGQADYRSILKDDDSLACFLRAMQEFDANFCAAMMEGDDFTLKLEVHGNAGRLIHARSNLDRFRRPSTKIRGNRIGS